MHFPCASNLLPKGLTCREYPGLAPLSPVFFWMLFIFLCSLTRMHNLVIRYTQLYVEPCVFCELFLWTVSPLDGFLYKQALLNELDPLTCLGARGVPLWSKYYVAEQVKQTRNKHMNNVLPSVQSLINFPCQQGWKSDLFFEEIWMTHLVTTNHTERKFYAVGLAVCFDVCIILVWGIVQILRNTFRGRRPRLCYASQTY